MKGVYTVGSAVNVYVNNPYSPQELKTFFGWKFLLFQNSYLTVSLETLFTGRESRREAEVRHVQNKVGGTTGEDGHRRVGGSCPAVREACRNTVRDLGS